MAMPAIAPTPNLATAVSIGAPAALVELVADAVAAECDASMIFWTPAVMVTGT